MKYFSEFWIILQLLTWKLEFEGPIWRSHTQNSINFEFCCYDRSENYYSGIFKITENGCKLRFGYDESNMAAIYTFSRENQKILVLYT